MIKIPGPCQSYQRWWCGRHRCRCCRLFFARRDGVWLTVGKPYHMCFYCNRCQRAAREELLGSRAPEVTQTPIRSGSG